MASPRSPGFNSIAGPSSASYFPQQQSTTSSSGYYDSPPGRRKRHSLVPSMGTGGTLQDSPIEEETDHDSRTKLVPDKPLSSSPSRINQSPTPPPKPSQPLFQNLLPHSHSHSQPPSRQPSSILMEPGTNQPYRRVSVAEPEPIHPHSPHSPGRRQRSYDTQTDRDRDREYNGGRERERVSQNKFISFIQ